MIGEGDAMQEFWFTPGRGIVRVAAAGRGRHVLQVDGDARAGHDGAMRQGGDASNRTEMAGVTMTDLSTGSISKVERGVGAGVGDLDAEICKSPIFWEVARETGLPGTLLKAHSYTYIEDGMIAGTQLVRKAAVQLGVQPMDTVRAHAEAVARAAAKAVRGAGKAGESTGAESKAGEGTGGKVNAAGSTGEGDNALDTTLGLLVGKSKLSDEKVQELIEAWEDEGGSVVEG